MSNHHDIVEARLDNYLKLALSYPYVFANDEHPSSLKVILDKSTLFSYQYILYERARQLNQPEHWYDLGIVAEDKWVIVLRDLVLFPDGSYRGYIRKLNRNSSLQRSGNDIVILPLLEKQVLLLSHFRHEERRWTLEIPRGFGERGLTIEENAIKELQEETGLSPASIEIIGGINSTGAFESVVYVVAELDSQSVVLDKIEGISNYQFVTISDLRNMIILGDIVDSYTIQAYAYASLHGHM